MTTEDSTKNTLATAQELMNFSETVDSIIDLTEGTRRKLIANGTQSQRRGAWQQTYGQQSGGTRRHDHLPEMRR